MLTILNEQERYGVQAAYDTAAALNAGVRRINNLAITRSGTTATVVRKDHGLTSGQTATVEGAAQAAYNIAAAMTVVDADTFTYTVAGSPATPATPAVAGSVISAVNLEQSKYQTIPGSFHIVSIAAATTVKVEAALRLSLGFVQVGADLTSSDNNTLIAMPAKYNFVRLRRSAGSGAVKIYAQG